MLKSGSLSGELVLRMRNKCELLSAEMSGSPPTAPTPTFDDASAQQQSTSDAVLRSHVPISHDTIPHQNPEDDTLQTRRVDVASQSEPSTAVPSFRDRTFASEDHTHQLKDVAQVCSLVVRVHVLP